jgi:hypothetical protein
VVLSWHTQLGWSPLSWASRPPSSVQHTVKRPTGWGGAGFEDWRLLFVHTTLALARLVGSYWERRYASCLEQKHQRSKRLSYSLSPTPLMTDSGLPRGWSWAPLSSPSTETVRPWRLLHRCGKPARRAMSVKSPAAYFSVGSRPYIVILSIYYGLC